MTTPEDTEQTPRPRETAIFHYVFDEIMPKLKPIESVLLIHLLTYTHGRGRSVCRVTRRGLSRIARGLTIREAWRALERLDDRGHIAIVGYDMSNPDRAEREITISMFIDSPLPLEDDDDEGADPEILSLEIDAEILARAEEYCRRENIPIDEFMMEAGLKYIADFPGGPGG